MYVGLNEDGSFWTLDEVKDKELCDELNLEFERQVLRLKIGLYVEEQFMVLQLPEIIKFLLENAQKVAQDKHYYPKPHVVRMQDLMLEFNAWRRKTYA